MKRLMMAILCALTVPLAARVLDTNAPEDSLYIKVYINKIKNVLAHDCKVDGVATIGRNESLSLKPPLLIPFISIDKYIKQYTSSNPKPFTPDDALTIETSYGKFRLWASEEGVMYAQDPKDGDFDDESWQAQKILGVTRKEHGNKNLYVASLVFKALKNRLSISLESPL